MDRRLRSGSEVQSSIRGLYPSYDGPFGVNLKPFSSSKDMILTIAVRAFTLATAANFGLSPFKVHCTIIVRGNDNLPFAISEPVFFVSYDSNQSVVE